MNKLKAIAHIPIDLWEQFITYLPGPAGYVLRDRYWRKRLRHLGHNVRIDPGVYFQNPGYIAIDDNAWIDRQVMLLAGLDHSAREKIHRPNDSYPGEAGVVHIGKNVHVGPGCVISGIAAGVWISDDCGISAGCKIYAFSHHFRSRENPGNATIRFCPRVEPERQCLIVGPVYMGPNSGLALHTVVLPGASIGENCFVAINSVIPVGAKLAANSLVAGDPARRTGPRFETDE